MFALLESNIATQGHVITGLEHFYISTIPPNVPLKRKVPLFLTAKMTLLYTSARHLIPSHRPTMLAFSHNFPGHGLNGMKITATILVATLSSVTAHAQIFKCTGSDGTVGFSSVPCPADQGTSQYLGEVQKGQAESSAEVTARNLRAAEIMREGRTSASPNSGSVPTIIPDNTKGRVADREREARRQAREASGEVRIRTNCFNYGQVRDCYDSEGGRFRTINNDGYSHTYGSDGAGNKIRINSDPNGNSTTRVIPGGAPSNSDPSR